MQQLRQRDFTHNTIPLSFFRGYWEYRATSKEKKTPTLRKGRIYLYNNYL